MRLLVSVLVLLVSGCGCKGVIGVMYNQRGQVRMTFPGGPAAILGIEAPDKILNHKTTQGRPDTKVLVKWIDVSDDYKVKQATVIRQCADNFNASMW